MTLRYALNVNRFFSLDNGDELKASMLSVRDRSSVEVVDVGVPEPLEGPA
jgi:hypothetical protein